MRALLDRFGCLIQIAIAAAAWAALARTDLPGWGSALLAVGASYVGTWGLAVVVGVTTGGEP